MKKKTEFERMQEFAGLKPTKKPVSKSHRRQQLDENIGGIVGIGAINNPLEREKPDYELAFEHYVGNHLAEDARTDAEEEGYRDGMRDEKEDLGEGDTNTMDINDLVKYLEQSLENAKQLSTEGESENQDLGSLVLSIQDGLNDFPI